MTAPTDPRDEESVDLTPGVVWTEAQLAVVRDLLARAVRAETQAEARAVARAQEELRFASVALRHDGYAAGWLRARADVMAPAVSGIRCDCEPTRYDDGSVGHEQECAVYPWCPHEVCAYSCQMPCGCPCRPCAALSEANR